MTAGVERDAARQGSPEGAEEAAPPSIFAGVARHSMVYALGMIIGRSVSFLLLPLYTRYLTPADYGVLGLVEMTLDFVSILAGAQLAAGVFRFYHKADSRAERDRVISTSFLLVAGMYALVGLAAFLGAPLLSRLVFGSEANTVLFRIASVNLGMSALQIVPLSLARVEDRSTLYVGSGLAKLALMVVLNLLFLVGMGLGVMGVFLSSLISNVLVGVVLAMWVLRRVSLAFDAAAARSLLRYGLPLMGMQVATFLATFGDRFFLQAAADEAAVGLYNLAYQFGFLMVMVGFGPIDQVWNPRRFRLADDPNRDDALARAFVLINVVLFTVALGIVVLVGDVLRIMTTPAFHAAAAVVPVILVAYILQCWASIQDIGILVRERTEYLTLANVAAAVVALVGYALLVPPFLAWGAAAATVLSFMVRYLLTFHYSQRLWPVRYRWRPMVVLTAWTVLVSGFALVLPAWPIVISLAARFGLIAAYFLGLWFLPILEERDRKAAMDVVRRWRRR